MDKVNDADRLIGELAQVLGLGQIGANADGGYQLSLGADTEIIFFGGDTGESLLVVVPIATLPLRPEYGPMLYLFRQNLFDTFNGGFRIAADEGGTLVFWTRLATAGLSGEQLAALADGVSDRVAELRAQLNGEGDEPIDDTPFPGTDSEEMVHLRG